MTSFVPVKIAHVVFEPAGGTDENLSPVVFMHGMTLSKEDWKDIPQIIADKTKRKTYAIDARNHGDSEFCDIFNLEINVDDLFHFMDSVTVPKAVLIGHSMGGVTAIKAALRNPEKVEMIFVEDMYTKKCPREDLDKVIGFIHLWMEGLKEVPKDLPPSEVLRFVVDYVFSKVPPDTPPVADKEKLIKSNIKFNRKPDGSYDVRFNKEVILRTLEDSSTIMSDSVGQYNGPAYFIYGGLSIFSVGKEEANIKEHFPNAELIEIKDATHSVHAEFPDEFVNTILSRLL